MNEDLTKYNTVPFLDHIIYQTTFDLNLPKKELSNDQRH